MRDHRMKHGVHGGRAAPLALAIGLLLATAALAPTPLPAQAPSATPLAEAPPFVNRVLPNGLEVVVLSDHSVPLVTVELAVRTGSISEPPELNGLSHLYEHMFFKSTNAPGAEEYLGRLAQLGLLENGRTLEEVVEYFFTTTSPNFPIAMRWMRDALLFPAFDPAEFAREQEIVVGELNRHESNPFDGFIKEMNGRLFYRYPSRKNPGGSRETVRAATTDMMRLIQSRYYVPNNSAIIVAGDVEPEAVFRLVEQLFGDWPRRVPDPYEEFPLVEHPPLQRSEAAIMTTDIQNVTVQIGWHGPSIGVDDAATYAADVFSFILRQPNSRFQRALVDSGLAMGVDLGYYTQRNVGPIYLTLQTTPDRARAAVRAVYAEIARFSDPDYFTDEELESAKALLEADDLYSRDQLSEYVHTIGFWWSTTGLDYFRGYLRELRATSRDDITRYVTTYIQGKPHVALALLSPQSLRASGLTEADLIGN
jgi:zinc protease